MSTYDYINRITTIERQLMTLRRAIETGEHVAAGLTLSLTVGPLKDEEKHELCDVAVGTFTKEMLRLVEKALDDSLKLNLAMLRTDHTRATEFLAKADKTWTVKRIEPESPGSK